MKVYKIIIIIIVIKNNFNIYIKSIFMYSLNRETPEFYKDLSYRKSIFSLTTCENPKIFCIFSSFSTNR